MQKSETVQITKNEAGTETAGHILSLEAQNSKGNTVEIIPVTEDEVLELLAQIDISQIEALLEVYKIRRARGYSFIYDPNCLICDSIDSAVGLNTSSRRFPASFVSDVFHEPFSS
jgi:hypothetical protein